MGTAPPAALVLAEPLPQHFDNPSALGMYDADVLRANGFKRLTASGSGREQQQKGSDCVAHRAAGPDERMRAFQAAAPAYAAAVDAVARLHSLTAPLHYAHRGWDCTHFCSAAVYVWNVELARVVAALDRAADQEHA